MADDDNAVVSLTYRQLAEQLGIKPASAKARALRNRWRHTTGNDRLARVLVPVSALEKAETATKSPAVTATATAGMPMLNELVRQIADLQRTHTADLDRLRQEHGLAIEQIRELHNTAQVLQVETHQAEIAGLHRAHEAETARLMLIIAELRRPWWRRWFGKS
jgi:hypothetical protein